MQADLAFVQALRGAPLADADRKSLDADHLFVLTLRGVVDLMAKEKRSCLPTICSSWLSEGPSS